MNFSSKDREYYDKLLAECDQWQEKNGKKTYTIEEAREIIKLLFKKEKSY